MEQAQCRLEVAKIPMETGGGLAGALSNVAISRASFDNCMIGKGWEKRPQ